MLAGKREMSRKGLVDRFWDAVLGNLGAPDPEPAPPDEATPEPPAAEAEADAAAPPGRPGFDQWMDGLAATDTAMEAAAGALDPDAWANMPGCTDEELLRRRKLARRIAKVVVEAYQKVLDESEEARNRDKIRRVVLDALGDPQNPLSEMWGRKR